MSGPDPTGRTQAGKRPVRSYVIRGGRLTSGQARALERLWPRYGIEGDGGRGPLDFAALFGREAEVIVEIGFGNGEATWRTALAHPEQDFIGVEVHRPGVGRLLMALEEHAIGNVRIACQDAVEFMRESVPPASLAGVRIYFPDPWPKKRHHKRRLVQPEFVDTLAGSLAPGGVLHIATDWAPYAEYMTEVLSTRPSFRNLAASGDYSARPDWRPQTRYERRGVRLGHRVYDLLYERAT
jgi:tRNA (guanine-N7-)-methyltransferase